jgi:hypothetical protein
MDSPRAEPAATGAVAPLHAPPDPAGHVLLDEDDRLGTAAMARPGAVTRQTDRTVGPHRRLEGPLARCLVHMPEARNGADLHAFAQWLREQAADMRAAIGEQD